MPLKLFEADEGATVRVHDTVYVEDVLTDPATVTFKYRTPEGVTVSVTPVRQSTGTYYWDMVLTEPGVWWVRYESTGNEGAEEQALICKRSQF